MIQRVDKASVSIEGKNVGCIGEGLVVFIGVENRDTERDVMYLADKTAGLRIFSDSAGKFNLSCKDIDGECLIISQFTLFADTRHGKRPGFMDAAAPDLAEKLFNLFIERVRAIGLRVATGVFHSHMIVEIYNNGPVTIMINSRDKIV